VAPVLAPHLPALGTDVAAPDQQSPVESPSPASGGSGFGWSDAGIGAGGAVVLAASLAAGLMLRRRRSALAG
jgi:hypothetical protein